MQRGMGYPNLPSAGARMLLNVIKELARVFFPVTLIGLNFKRARKNTQLAQVCRAGMCVSRPVLSGYLSFQLKLLSWLIIILIDFL